MTTDLIKHNPLLKKPVMTVLALAEDVTDRAALETAAAAAWDPSFSQTPGAIIDVLVRGGSMTACSFVNGEPYEGTLEDMQLDETVPDDAVAEVRLSLTDEGRALRTAYEPERTVAELLESRPQYDEVFRSVVSSCATEAGAALPTLEALIATFPVTGGAEKTKVYPQYFIDALETAGAITWDGAWRATAAGRSLLAS
ncbi:hypothetical protein [uncultured Adlercreutzia sp.]|uniref:hypothetical protein n=1 Tax=uncultured Adlercreutzia sp. TaxID=875803 RepID=UPI0025E5DD53|nr:hypothetical protein [uncultured Adlercreutzia sp.]MCI9262356.1 hypothetical protein [Eggerthellaceae bacterium]